MPEISRSYGIVIKLYYEDHLLSHFHAQYGEFEALVAIETLAVIAGTLPARAQGSDPPGEPFGSTEDCWLHSRDRSPERSDGTRPQSTLRRSDSTRGRKWIDMGDPWKAFEIIVDRVERAPMLQGKCGKMYVRCQVSRRPDR